MFRAVLLTTSEQLNWGVESDKAKKGTNFGFIYGHLFNNK